MTRPPTARSLTAAAYIFMVVMMGTTMPTPLYPAMSAAYGFGDAVTTVIFAVYAVGVVAGLVVFGRWSEVLGRRPVLAVALVFSALSALLFLLASTTVGTVSADGNVAGLVLIFLGRVLAGLAAGIFTATGTVTVMENAPPGREPLAVAVATAANIGGLGAGILVAGIVADVFPTLTTPFLVHTVLLGLAAVLLPTVRDPVVRDHSAGRMPRLRVPRMPDDARRLFVGVLPVTVAGYTVCGLYASVAPNFMAAELGMGSPLTIGFVAGSMFFASAVGQIAMRNLRDRTLMVTGTVLLMLCAALLVVAVQSGLLVVLVSSAVIGGVGQGLTFMTGMRAMTAAVHPGQRTAVTTSYFIVSYLSLSVPAVLAGVVSVPLGLIGATVVFGVATVLLGGVGLTFVRRF